MNCRYGLIELFVKCHAVLDPCAAHKDGPSHVCGLKWNCSERFLPDFTKREAACVNTGQMISKAVKSGLRLGDGRCAEELIRGSSAERTAPVEKHCGGHAVGLVRF